MIKNFKQNKALTLAIFGFIVWCGYAASEFSKHDNIPKLHDSAKFKKYTYQYLNSYKIFILPLEIGKSAILESYTSTANTKTNVLIKLAAKNYTLEKEGYDNIGSVKCIAMRYKPIIRNFPWVQMWADNKTGKIIAVKYWNSNKKQKNIIKINVNSNISNLKLPDQSLYREIYLPDGYKLLNINNQSNDTRLLVFGDGLNIICISFEKNTMKRKLISIAQLNYGLIAQRYNKLLLCTVIADLPKEEILKIANSVAKSNGIIK